MTDLARTLESARETHKLLVPYVMGGIPDRDSFTDVLAAVGEHADAIEVGLPFSDPLMDGPVIAAAGERAIEEGTGPLDALDLASGATTTRVAMTYYNPIHRTGERDFCSRAASCGFAGLIVPDLPLEESESLRAACADERLAWIPLVAPTSPPERVARIAETATGFVYAVSTLGVTGARESLSERAASVVEKVRAATDAVVLVGIGVSTPHQARDAAADADGVVIGTAVVRRAVDEGPASAASFLAEVRSALDR
ncbi:MAG: tryptophan synthase subunit alpha [Actinomycetota bacterium]|nr:tryptophan synthase subunit alpha [Actinomycetota bacterium]